ncbi:MAG: cysteine desulfurase family protein [Syntrophorhabdales bacterium]|jgi:cysteine desulfurase
MDVVYLDYAATTPAAKEVIDTMIQYFAGVYGNPSSTHALGNEARQALEEARATIARYIGARRDEVFFTSGGSEANNTALKGIAFANRHRGEHIIVSSIEHHSILEACLFLEEQGFRVTYLPVDRHAWVSPNDVEKAITDKTILISVMHANNEVGTIEPITEIGRIAKEKEVYFHTDAVQTLGHIPVDVNDLSTDLLSASAHKLYGPKGVGLLYVRRGVKISPLIHGGDQEGDLRAGTENVAGIVGFAKAAEVAEREYDKEARELVRLREMLTDGLIGIGGVHLNGHPDYRLSGNVNVTIDGADGEDLLLDLRLEGICASNGSACNSVKTRPSHVLVAMGLSPTAARSSLRFTMGRQTRESDVENLLDVMPSVVTRCRRNYNPYI